MIPDEILRELIEQNGAKIVLLVADGLGGVPHDGRTELEAADIPCLNRLASESELGLTDPIAAASRRAAGRRTWRCSATTRCSTRSAAACSRRSAWASR